MKIWWWHAQSRIEREGYLEDKLNLCPMDPPHDRSWLVPPPSSTTITIFSDDNKRKEIQYKVAGDTTRRKPAQKKKKKKEKFIIDSLYSQSQAGTHRTRTSLNGFFADPHRLCLSSWVHDRKTITNLSILNERVIRGHQSNGVDDYLFFVCFSFFDCWMAKPTKKEKNKKEKDFLPRSVIARRVARQPPFRAKWRGFWLDVLETNIEYGRLYRDSRSDPRQRPNVPDCPQQSNCRMARLHLALKGRPIKSFYILCFFFKYSNRQTAIVYLLWDGWE